MAMEKTVRGGGSSRSKARLSEAVYRVLKEKFRFRKRGVVDIKGIGAMETYYLLAPT